MFLGAMICESNLTSIKQLKCLILNSRDRILQTVKIAYTAKNKKNLPIYGIKCKELREFATTAKDLERGISRIPLQLSRLLEEDILDEQTEAMISNILPEREEESKGKVLGIRSNNKYYYVGVNRMQS